MELIKRMKFIAMVCDIRSLGGSPTKQQERESRNTRAESWFGKDTGATGNQSHKQSEHKVMQTVLQNYVFLFHCGSNLNQIMLKEEKAH